MPVVQKPLPLRPGDAIRVIAPASPVEADRFNRGCAELERIGYVVRRDDRVLARYGYFAGSDAARQRELFSALSESDTRAVICARGGYGSNYLLDDSTGWSTIGSARQKILLGYSDITSLQVFLWQKFAWTGFYAPMAAAGFDGGPGAPGGYDAASFDHAVSQTKSGWSIALGGEALVDGWAEGIVLGGCLTLIEATLGTPWEPDTRGAILILEDRGMKPWQVDRALVHLKQAGKLSVVRGIVAGDFPECEGPAGSPTVRDVLARILGSLGVPMVWNVPFGHTKSAMLTIPLGVRAALQASANAQLEVLEPVCAASD